MRRSFLVRSARETGPRSRREAARLVTGTFGVRLGSLAVTMVISVLIARCLHPAGRGTYQLLMTIAGTSMALGHLSVEQAQTALWPQVRYRSAVAANSFPLGLVVGGIAALLALAATRLGSPFFSWSAAAISSSAPVVLAAAGVPLGVSTLYLTNVTMLDARVRTANRAALFGGAAQCCGLAILALSGAMTVTSAVAVWAVSTAVPSCLMLIRLRTGPRSFSLKVARRTVMTGLCYHAGPASTYLLLRIDVFLLAAQAPAQSVGVYALAVGVAETARFAADSLSQVALSRQVQADAERAVEVTVRTTRIAALVGVCSTLAVVAAAPMVVPLAYGRAFAPAVPLLMLLLPGVLVLSVARPASVYLLRARRAWYVVAPSTAGLAVNVAVNLALIPALGAAGCALASLAGYVVMAVFQLWLFDRISGTRARLLLPRRADVGLCLSAMRAILSRRAVRG
jgi:O-antigen/teichoic acid export membrane protein